MGKHHSQEFRTSIAKLIVEEHRAAHDVALEKGLPDSTISRWVAAYRAELRASAVKQPMTQEGLVRAKTIYTNDLKQIERENELLNRTIQFLTEKHEP